MLWGLVNTIQLLAFLPLMSFQMPGFLITFLKNLNKFNFYFIDVSDLIVNLLDLKKSLKTFDS